MEFDRNELLGDLRARARQAIAGNLVGFKKMLGGRRQMSLEARSERPWDFVAKGQMAHKIYKEEDARARRDAAAAGQPNAANNPFDAIRHARASQRLTGVVGPRMAEVLGLGVEAVGLGRNLAENAREFDDPEHAADSVAAGFSAAAMDLRNNAEGRRAATEGRAIRREALQMAPNRTEEYEYFYDAPPPGREGLPRR